MLINQQKLIAHEVLTPMRVFIVAPVKLYREGLRALLAQAPSLSVIGIAENLPESLEQWNDVKPDVLLLDINIPNGLEIVRRVYTSGSRLKVIALAMGEDEDSIVSWAEVGISAFVAQDGSVEDLIDAIYNAAAGRLLCNPTVAGKLIRRLSMLGGMRAEQEQPDGLTHLTSREHEILELVERGLSNKEIARRLDVGVATVKSHVHNLMEKLNVHRRERAAAYLRDHQYD